MLEKYLSQKGITAETIYRLFPDIEDSVKNYLSIKDLGEGGEYDAELNKLSSEIVDYLQKNEDVIDSAIANDKAQEIAADIADAPQMEIPAIEIPAIQIPGQAEFPSVEHFENLQQEEIEKKLEEAKAPVAEVHEVVIPEIHTSEKEENDGYIIQGAMVTPHIWMKILALAGLDYKWKTHPDLERQFWIGDKGGVSTNLNPLGENKTVEIWIFGDNKEYLENLYSIVQSKILGFFSKDSAHIGIGAGVKDMVDAMSSDSEEPVTKIPYKLLDDAVIDLWKLKSMDELVELVSLSKKYGCGCGSI